MDTSEALSRIRFLIFDADDTLLDYECDSRAALSSTCCRSGIQAGFSAIHEAYRQINLQLWEQAEAGLITRETVARLRFDRLLARFGVTDVNAGDMAEIYLEELSRNATFLPGVENALGVLHQQYTMFLLTNGISRVQRNRFRSLGLDRFFDRIVISDDVGLTKPDPALVDLLMDRIRWKPSEVLVIGDSMTSDRGLAQAAGIAFCRMSWKSDPHETDPQVDFLAHDMNELMELLNRKSRTV